MERYSDRTIEIINGLHTEQLEYNSEYLPLIDAANQLAAYEDTGFTPEKIMEVLKSKGRLQIYPCSIGDEVFYIKRYCGKPLGGPRKGHVQMLGTTRAGIRIKVREDHDHNSDFAFGKTVFLTESEAEAAWERMEGK